MQETAKDQTVSYLKAAFRRHYEKTDPFLPQRLEQREFGFMFFDTDMVQRHLAIPAADALKRFLVNRTPAHAYYSSAFYQRPDAAKMDDKGWLGADLIFDLDADHIRRVKGMAYKQFLHEVQVETMRLVDEFLLDDFGFEEEDLLIAFSGGRGFHVHVRSEGVWKLSSHERREIVDYITGTGLGMDAYVERVPIGSKTSRYKAEVVHTLRVKPPANTGWSRRLTTGLIHWVRSLAATDKESALRIIQDMPKIGPAKAEKIYKNIFENIGVEEVVKRLKRGVIDIFPRGVSFDQIETLTEKLGLDLRRETDEPVTSDVKRLIRLPYSLHGKTGMMVVPLKRKEMDDFEPLRDAFPPAFGDEPVRVAVPKAMTLALRDETFNLNPGVTEVPEFAAVFLLCRGMAQLA